MAEDGGAQPDRAGAGGEHGFHVSLDNFDGPFDLLLQLINKHRLDITEVALSRVTDEFIAQVRAAGARWDLERTSSFLVVAATLLDLKAARLLPSGEVDDPEDLALLEARDLLFARLLQYRAFKRVSVQFAALMDAEARRFARPGGLEEEFRGLLPEVTIPGGAERLARLAVRALSPPDVVTMPLEQLHVVTVNVGEQAGILVDRLRGCGQASFRALTAGADRMTVVARFLALLELFRQAAVSFEQLSPLGELTVRWTGQADGELSISDEFDAPAGQERADQEPAGAAVGRGTAGPDEQTGERHE
ncbi:MAG: segregation and condensation protein A [Propionibacterium acidifaciens]